MISESLIYIPKDSLIYDRYDKKHNFIQNFQIILDLRNASICSITFVTLSLMQQTSLNENARLPCQFEISKFFSFLRFFLRQRNTSIVSLFLKHFAVDFIYLRP